MWLKVEPFRLVVHLAGTIAGRYLKLGPARVPVPTTYVPVCSQGLGGDEHSRLSWWAVQTSFSLSGRDTVGHGDQKLPRA